MSEFFTIIMPYLKIHARQRRWWQIQYLDVNATASYWNGLALLNLLFSMFWYCLSKKVPSSNTKNFLFHIWKIRVECYSTLIRCYENVNQMLDENWRIVEKNQQGINLRVTPTVWRIPRNVSETIHSLSCHRLLSIENIQTNRGGFLWMK